MARILLNVEKAAIHLVRGIAYLMALLYYLDPEDAKPFLALFSEGGKPPDPDDWSADVKAMFASMSSHLEGAADKIETVREALDVRSVAPYAIGLAVVQSYWGFISVAAFGSQGAAKSKKGLVIKGIVGFLGLAALAYGGKLDELYDLLEQMTKNIAGMFPGKDKKAARIHGQIIGKLLGTMLVDRALFGKDSKLGKRLRENKKLNIAVEGMMLLGAYIGFLGAHYTGSVWVGFLTGIAGGYWTGGQLWIWTSRTS